MSQIRIYQIPKVISRHLALFNAVSNLYVSFFLCKEKKYVVFRFDVLWNVKKLNGWMKDNIVDWMPRIIIFLCCALLMHPLSLSLSLSLSLGTDWSGPGPSSAVLSRTGWRWLWVILLFVFITCQGACHWTQFNETFLILYLQCFTGKQQLWDL